MTKCGNNGIGVAFYYSFEGVGVTVKKGMYRHYKGNFYEVLHTAQHSETEERMVVYRALYGDGGIWVRPYEMFNEKIHIDGRTVKRFTFVVPLQEN